jgi:hypothetical protein
VPTDYWLVSASSNFTSPSSWTPANELRLTNASFNIENAAPTTRGYFLGDYQGLAAAGNNFYALFGQAGSGSSDPSNIFFRDPPPEADTAAGNPAPAATPLPVAPASGDGSHVAAHPVPSPVGYGSILDGPAVGGVPVGLLEHSTDPTGLPSITVGDNRPPAAATTGPDVAAIDFILAAGGWGGESPLGPSGFTSGAEDGTADGSTEDWSLDSVFPDIGSED